MNRAASTVRGGWGKRSAALAVGLLLAACSGDDPGARTLYGPATPLGEGEARVFLIVEDGQPLELGVALTEDAFRGLPEDGDPSGMMMPDGHTTHEYALDLPAENPTPFRAVTLDWNPAGHEPPGIYDVPHLDIHFYTISHAERHAIVPSDPEFARRASHEPPPEYMPAGYAMPVPEAVPMMGTHWVDLSSPELDPENPERFTRTFIYGSWDGRMIFMEPMVTLEHLLTKPDETHSLALPERFDPEGYYPGSWRIRWDGDAGEHRISLVDFQHRR
jgi:hypothetical protein